MSKRLFGATFKQKLLFFPNADTKPEEKQEISEAALFRCLIDEEKYGNELTNQVEIPKMLSVIDKLSKITESEIHESSMGSVTDLGRAFHAFVVFKTTSKKDGVYWWSLEKNTDYIVLQRSHNKNDVKEKCYGEERNKVKSIEENLKGKGSIRNLFAILWAHKIIPENYHIKNSNCQSLVTIVSKQITEIGYDYKGFFKFSPRENERYAEMLDLINLITNAFDKEHPLFPLIYYEDTNLFDTVLESGEYYIDGYFDGYTPLHLAIIFSKTKMVQHLLQKWKADPTKKGKTGKNALHLAVQFAKENTDIIDLLLAHGKVDINERDEENGWTALHFAIYSYNSIAVKHLIEKGADPNICDKNGQSPLHLAARCGMKTEIIDLILKAKNNKGIDDVDDESAFGFTGKTALHMAAMASNETIAEYLIKKGANINYRDKLGRTPLYFAALHAKDMKIIDLLLENIKEEDVDQYKNDDEILVCANLNEHGLESEIIDRLHRKGITEIREYPVLSTDKYDIISASNEKTENNNRSIDTVKSLFQQYISIPLLISAIKFSDVKIVRLLIRMGTDINTVTWEGGANALQMASYFAKTTDLIDVILENGQFDINGGDDKGMTPLQYAISGKNPAVNVRHLIKNGADPTVRNKIGFTLLHTTAAYTKHLDILDFLLANEKVDINERDETGCTALNYAIANSNMTTARYLIDKGADPNIAEEYGWTPLHTAAKLANDMDIVELLLNHKDVDVNCLDNKGQNPLQFAKDNEHGLGERIANRLKEKGAVEQINKEPTKRVEEFKKLKEFQDPWGRGVGEASEVESFLTNDKVSYEDKVKKMLPMILSTAIINSDVEKVRDLIEKGTDISTVTWKGGMNALQAASKCAKTTDLIDVILENGKFDISGGDNIGQTPLHYAILGNNPAINVRHLIKKGADPTIPDKNGVTPLQLAAAEAKTMDLIDLFLNNEVVDVNHCDNQGNNTLFYIQLNKHGLRDSIISRLRERGAQEFQL